MMCEELSFEAFPFRKLNIDVPRRDLFQSMLKQVRGSTSRMSNKPTYKVEDLGLLSLDEISQIVPALYGGCEFEADEPHILGKAPRHLNFVRLFRRDSPAHRIFQYFNEHKTLSELSFTLRKRFPMDEKTSLLFMRGLFLFLVEEGFAYPEVGVPDDD